MDTRLTNTAPHLPLAPARLDVVPVHGAVRTDLAAPTAVSAQVGADQARWNKDQRRFEQGNTPKHSESSIETDRETGDLVYKIIDPQSRATLSQYPYESLLKLRAYIKSADEHANKES